MSVVSIVLRVVHVLLIVFLVLLWVRIILELIQGINRGWRPRGALLVAAEIVFTVTDPPVRLARRLVPPLRLGPVAIDLGPMLVMLATVVLISIVGAFAIVA